MRILRAVARTAPTHANVAVIDECRQCSRRTIENRAGTSLRQSEPAEHRHNDGTGRGRPWTPRRIQIRAADRNYPLASTNGRRLLRRAADLHRDELIEQRAAGFRQLCQANSAIAMHLVGGVRRKIVRQTVLAHVREHPVHHGRDLRVAQRRKRHAGNLDDVCAATLGVEKIAQTNQRRRGALDAFATRPMASPTIQQIEITGGLSIRGQGNSKKKCRQQQKESEPQLPVRIARGRPCDGP
jgi:hypothetical protein